MQVAASRFRVPDVTVTRAAAPFEAIIPVASLLCIEVLSRDQRMSEIEERAKDYLAMGVPMVDRRSAAANSVRLGCQRAASGG